MAGVAIEIFVFFYSTTSRPSTTGRRVFAQERERIRKRARKRERGGEEV
jgi:hypothetical protein